MARVEVTIGTAPNSPVLSAYMASRGEADFIRGPLGSGKTFGTLQKMLAIMCEQEPNGDGVRPTRWLAVRNTYPDLMNTTIRDFKAFFQEPHFGKFKHGSKEPPTYHVKFHLEDSTRVEADVIFLALDRPDAAENIRGFQGTGGWLNETKELHKTVVDAVQSRMTRYPSFGDGGVRPTWSGIIGDTNSMDEDEWYAKLELDPPEGWNFFRQPGGVRRIPGMVDANGEPMWEPNPDAENLEHLHPEYYARTMKGKSTSWIAVNLANEFGFHIDGDPVHKNYVDSVHCPGIIPYQKGFPIFIGIDFGRTPAAVFVMVHPATGRKYIIDELCAESMSQALFAPELKRFIAERYPEAPIAGVFADPAGDSPGQENETTPIMILNAHGIPAQPARTNAISARRAAIAVPLLENCMDGRPRLFVSARAKMTRKGLQGGFAYKRMHTQSERYSDKPDKNLYSHPVEAAEYALMMAGEYHETFKPRNPLRRPAESYLAKSG